jgi:predicted transcriptional regulator
LKSSKSVLEILFPAVRAELIRLLFALPPREYYVRELMLKSNLALHTVQDELRKLSALGLVTSRSTGARRFYQANRKHPIYPHLQKIVQLSERSPRTRQSALLRPRGSTKKRRPKLSHLPPDYPINWGTLRRRT